MKDNKDLPNQAGAKSAAAHKRADPSAKVFAAKAKNLEVLRDSVVDAASVGAGLWFSYLFVLFYLGIAVGSVTHRDLLFEAPVKLPFLNVDLPLVGFFALGPGLFLVVHAYVLLHFVLLAGKAGIFHAELDAQIADEETKSRLRRQLPSNIFVQFLAGPIEVREGRLGLMLRLIAQITLVWGPLVLLVFFLLQFLPYHHEPIAWWQRIAVVCDLALLWTLWPSVARGEASWIKWRDFRRGKVALAALASLVPIVLVLVIITFPGEGLDDSWLSRAFVSPHDLLLGGHVDAVSQKPTSLWSNRLVLPGIDVIDHAKFDTEARIKALPETLSLRGRRLEGAVLVGAGLRKVDLTGAQLQGATLDEADLRDADFGCGEQHNCANLQRASFVHALLPGAMLDYAEMGGAILAYAQLAGASLSYAKLIGADLFSAELEGASLDSADLRRARLLFAHIQGASLVETRLEEADLFRAFVWRANARNSKVEGATIVEPQTQPKYSFFSPDPHCEVLACDWTAASFQVLKQFIDVNVTRPALQQGASDRIAKNLDPAVLKPDAEKNMLKVWNDLVSLAPSIDDHEKNLLDQVAKMACLGTTGLYAIRGFARDFELRLSTQSARVRKFADVLLDATGCPGARGLSERDRDRLRKLRDLPEYPAPTDQIAPEGDLAVALRTELTEPAMQNLASNVGSPSVAVNGQVVFYTGNWYAAVSSDGGKKFSYVDPFAVFPAPPKFGFCCGQVVNYIPAIDTFVWLLNYSASTGVNNIQKLAHAKSADVIAGKWHVHDISPKTLGVPGANLDYGDLAVGANNLYVTVNIYTTEGQSAGSAVVRIPFDGISRGEITTQVFVSKDLNSLRVAQNCGTTAFFAAHQDTSTLAVFSWDEAQPQPVKSFVDVARWVSGSGYVSKGPDGRRWLDRADPRITGATLAGDVLWLAWSVNSDSQKPQPFVRIAKIDVRHMSSIANQDISDPDSAVAFPALATNADGEVGLSYMIGGGRKFPSHAVAILTGAPGKFVTLGSRGPLPDPATGGGDWGDYLTVRPVFPDRRLFAAAGYTFKGREIGSIHDATPQLVIFGRPEDVKKAVPIPASEQPEDVKEAVPIPASKMHPGVERWGVKTGTDPDAALVGPTSKPTQITVEDLVKLPRPADMSPATESFPSYQNQRARPVETSVYSVEATIVAAKVELSGDYKLVLQGPSGQTMIAAAPNPLDEFVAPNSAWKGEVTEVRRQLDAKKLPSGKILGTRARVVGVGFFNQVRGQLGVATNNGIELHPVLGIEFIESGK